MRDHPVQRSARFVASLLAATLLAFAALPALHGTHGVGGEPAAPAFQQADAAWTAAEADCPLCRGLVRARVAPAPPQGEFRTRVGSLPLANGHQRIVPNDAPRVQRARAPPALA